MNVTSPSPGLSTFQTPLRTSLRPSPRIRIASDSSASDSIASDSIASDSIASDANVRPRVGASPARDASLAELRDTVNKVIGSVFYEPMLRATRDSALKGTIGHGGRGEEVFQGQLDQILAERIGQASGQSLSQTLVDRFARAARAHHNAVTSRQTLLPGVTA